MKTSALLAAMALLGCAQPGPPQDATANAAPLALGADDQGPAAAQDMAVLYGRVCLTAFPDETAMQGALQAYGAQQLAPAEVAGMLHADPGRGWRLATPVAHYVVTIENPPYRTCALRRMTRQGLPTALPYIAMLKAYAASHALSLGQVQQIRLTPNGLDVQMLGSPLSRPGNLPGEFSSYITTNYHGRYDAATVPEAAGGVGVEVRMAHQFVPGAPA